MGDVQIGLFSINNLVCSYPENLTRVATAAEEAGLESVWTGEHVVLPDPQVPPSPMPPEARMLDGAIALTWAAAHTTRLRLGTGIIIVPQRNPLVLAKELASLDVLSGGRLLFGVGVGYLRPEFDALGIPMEDRGNRTLEYIEAMRAIWATDGAAYGGRYVSYSGVSANPKPVQEGGVPVVMGGHSPPAWRKAVTHSQGWFGFNLDLDAAKANLDGLAAAAERYERPSWLGPLEVTVTPKGRLGADDVARYGDLGVHRLVLNGPRATTTDVDALVAFVGQVGTDLVGRS